LAQALTYYHTLDSRHDCYIRVEGQKAIMKLRVLLQPMLLHQKHGNTSFFNPISPTSLPFVILQASAVARQFG
jgi:hypothetical protein